MAKRVAVIAFNPVNGAGLFQYLEAFFENGISCKVFAVADTTHIKTNSGIAITVDDVVANLKGREDDYDALVFSCGDAVPKFNDNADAQYNKDILEVIASFASKGKLMIGHCAAGMFYDMLGVADGRKVAVHPFVKQIIKRAVATDGNFEVDGNFYTAQTENTLWAMIPEVVKALK